MTIFTAEGLLEAGFHEPILLKPIERTDVLVHRGAKDIEGIYVVLHQPTAMARFLPPDHPRHIEFTSDECLAERWLSAASVLYIGKAPFRKADPDGKKDGLWQRIKELRGFVYRARTNHRGGEDLRRVPTRDTFLVTWKETDRPAEEERDLIKEFKDLHGGARPFANRNDGGAGPKAS
ncbi:hypothetical protein [Arthrobacter cupressi]